MALIQLIHFKRSSLTYACLWTLNNLINHHNYGIFDDLLAFQIGPALKVIHSCYNYSVTKAAKEKNTLFKYMKPIAEEKPNQVIQELYWFYNYSTGLGPVYTAALLSQYTEVLTFIFDDLVRDDISSKEVESEFSRPDHNPLLMTLANIIDHSMTELGTDNAA